MFRLDETIENELVRWAEVESSGLSVIWEEQLSLNPDVGTKLDYPYITLKIISGPIEIGSYNRERVGDGIYAYTSHYQFTLSIQCIAGPEANLKPLFDLQKSFNKETVKEGFRVAGFSFKSRETVIDTTSLLETMYERSASLDVFFAYQESVTDDNGVIEKIGVTPTINGVELDEFIVDSNP